MELTPIGQRDVCPVDPTSSEDPNRMLPWKLNLVASARLYKNCNCVFVAFGSRVDMFRVADDLHFTRVGTLGPETAEKADDSINSVCALTLSDLVIVAAARDCCEVQVYYIPRTEHPILEILVCTTYSLPDSAWHTELFHSRGETLLLVTTNAHRVSVLNITSGAPIHLVGRIHTHNIPCCHALQPAGADAPPILATASIDGTVCVHCLHCAQLLACVPVGLWVWTVAITDVGVGGTGSQSAPTDTRLGDDFDSILPDDAGLTSEHLFMPPIAECKCATWQGTATIVCTTQEHVLHLAIPLSSTQCPQLRDVVHTDPLPFPFSRLSLRTVVKPFVDGPVLVATSQQDGSVICLSFGTPLQTRLVATDVFYVVGLAVVHVNGVPVLMRLKMDGVVEAFSISYEPGTS